MFHRPFCQDCSRHAAQARKGNTSENIQPNLVHNLPPQTVYGIEKLHSTNHGESLNVVGKCLDLCEKSYEEFLS